MEGSTSSKSDLNWRKKVGSFYISDILLGRGEYSEVFLGCFENNYKKKVACKTVKKSVFQEDPYILKTLERQYNMLKDINHENIVKFYDMSETSNNWYFFFEFCNQGTLEDYIRKKKGQLSEAKALLVLLEICEGFKELYKLNIMHRDLKPANVMLSDGVVKISDFSFAKVLESSEKTQALMHSLVGTPFYTPLQILEGREYSSKCDVWSLGVMFYQMLFGRYPFVWKALANNDLKDGGIAKLTELIKKNPLDYPVGSKISPDIKKLLEGMLGKEEENRISWVILFDSLKKLDHSALSTNLPSGLDDAEKKNNNINNNSTFNKSVFEKTMNMSSKPKSNIKGITTLHEQLKLSTKIKAEEVEEVGYDKVLNKINGKLKEAEGNCGKSYRQSQKFLTPSQKYKSPGVRKNNATRTLLVDAIFMREDDMIKGSESDDEGNFKEEDEGSTNLEVRSFSFSPNVSDKMVIGYKGLEEGVKCFDEYLYFKRNIANFIDKLVHKLWHAVNMKKIVIKGEEFHQIVFSLLKYECIILEGIERVLSGKETLDLKLISQKQLAEKPAQLFAYYKTSNLYKNLLEIISSDLKFRKDCYLKEIYNTLKESLERDPKNYKQAFVEILNLNLSEIKNFAVSLCQQMKVLYEVLMKEYKSKKKEKELLVLMKCVVILFAPFDVFVWDTKESKARIDFEDFFKKLEEETAEELIKFITERDLAVLQSKLRSNFSDFVNNNSSFN